MGPGTGAVGLLAGGGRLPEVLAGAIHARGRPLICVQMVGESAALAGLADVFVRLAPGEWQRLLAVFAQHGVTEVLVAGRFDRADLPGRLRHGDTVARAFLEQAGDRRDQAFLGAFAVLLEQRGMRVAGQLAYIGDLVPSPGRLAGRPLLAEEERDVTLGTSIARSLAGHDVGQTVVLKGGVILAVEAAEGTDATIRRGGGMAAGAVVAKVSRPHQDPRFDLPTVGPGTIAVMGEVRARVLAIEAHRTIVVDRAHVIAAAEDAGITVVAVDAPPLPPAPPPAGDP